MGLYLEPKGDKNERIKWLGDNKEKTYHLGVEDPLIKYESIPVDEVLVCLVDNGAFVAIAVCYSRHEYGAFAKEDGRIKIWATLKKNVAKAVCPMWDSYIKN